MDTLNAIWQGLQAGALAQLPLGAALAGLFTLALLSATLLPLGSEAALFALAGTHADAQGWIWLAATLGNTLGGLVTYAMGRGAHRLLGPAPATPASSGVSDASATAASPGPSGRANALAQRWVRRHGAWVCLLAWLPVIGDPLCAAAGWLRLPVWPCALFMAIGKGGRYALLLWLAG
jgi:membrane protein YqaA with SNARE-associated domain